MQSMRRRLAFFVAIGSMVLATSSIRGASAESFEVKLHPPCLDLGQIEDVVDQGEQVSARAEHTVERLGVLLQRLRILPQHFADADDGVERRAQLVAHVGEELRLVLACLGELPALVLDFVEQPHVLDRDHRLVGEVVSSSICLSVNGCTRSANNEYTDRAPSRRSGTPRTVRKPPNAVAPRLYSGSARASGM